MKKPIGNKTFLFLLMLWTLWVSTVEAQEPEPDVGLWLARSCVGEANFDSVETGECAAILHIYLKRTLISNMSIYEVVRKYSAATKPRPTHPRKWILHMDRDLDEPKHWPRMQKKWGSVQSSWQEILWLCDDFLKGEITDPLPLADHYGSAFDITIPRRNGWFEIKTNFKNKFWSIIDPKRKAQENGH